MNQKNARIHPARLACAAALALVLCAVYAAGTGWLAVELVLFTTSRLEIDWSAERIRSATRTMLVIGWFAVAIPVFLAAVFQSMTISIAWHALRLRSWNEGMQEAIRKFHERLRADER